MNNTATTVKWLSILAIVIIVALLFRSCYSNKKPEKAIVTIKVDTVWKDNVLIDTQYVPHLVTEYVPKKYTVHDTLETDREVIKPTDTAAILKRFYEKSVYADTQTVTHGQIVISDTVSQNRIISRSLIASIQCPEITKVITTEKPHRTTLFLGAGLFGQKSEIFYGVNGTADLQFKNGKMYGVGYMLNQTGSPIYSFSFKIPIRLKHGN